MDRETSAGPIARAITATLWAALMTAVTTGVSRAQATLPAADAVSEASRIERLERMVSTVVEENRRLAETVRSLEERLAAGQARPPSPSLPAAIAPGSASAWAAPPPSDWMPPEPATPFTPPPEVPHPLTSRFRVDYDNGFAILPENLDETPFSGIVAKWAEIGSTGLTVCCLGGEAAP